uniref:Uncharacterized protein n=1 Tax=Oncorhynchus mykiss TaxID=8022 RepID=A0A8C7PRC3_ONCMY
MNTLFEDFSSTFSCRHIQRITQFTSDLHSVFNTEAGILNYYLPDWSLGIHVDESELDHTRLHLFGQSTIFLLGGIWSEYPPTAMYMHNGDVSHPGPAVSEEDWAVCYRYFQTSRVNMTIRKVLEPDTMTGHTAGYHENPDGDNVGLKRRRSDSSDTLDSLHN